MKAPGDYPLAACLPHVVGAGMAFTGAPRQYAMASLAGRPRRSWNRTHRAAPGVRYFAANTPSTSTRSFARDAASSRRRRPYHLTSVSRKMRFSEPQRALVWSIFEHVHAARRAGKLLTSSAARGPCRSTTGPPTRPGSRPTASSAPRSRTSTATPRLATRPSPCSTARPRPSPSARPSITNSRPPPRGGERAATERAVARLVREAARVCTVGAAMGADEVGASRVGRVARRASGPSFRA